MSLDNLIPNKLLLGTVNSFHWVTKEIVVCKFFLLVFHLVMELLLKQYKHGICCSPKWQLQLDFTFIPTFVPASMPILTTVSLVDSMLVLSQLLLLLRKYYIELMYQWSLLLQVFLQLLLLLKLFLSQALQKILKLLTSLQFLLSQL